MLRIRKDGNFKYFTKKCIILFSLSLFRIHSFYLSDILSLPLLFIIRMSTAFTSNVFRIISIYLLRSRSDCKATRFVRSSNFEQFCQEWFILFFNSQELVLSLDSERLGKVRQGFDSLKGQHIFLHPTAFRPAQGPTQPST
jgi:hypothetical protein